MAERIPLGDRKKCPKGYRRDPKDRTMCVYNSIGILLGDRKRCPKGYRRDPKDRTMCVPSKSKQTHKRTLKKRVVKKTSAKPKFEAFKVNQKVSVKVKGRTLGDQNRKFIAGKEFIEKEEGNVYNGFIMSDTEARNTMNIYSWNPIDPNCQRVVEANQLVIDIQEEYQKETLVWPGYAKNRRSWKQSIMVSRTKRQWKKTVSGREVDFDQPLIKVDFEPLPPDTYYVCYNLKPTPEGKEEDLFWRRYGVFHASVIDKPIPPPVKVRRSRRIRNR